MRTPPTIAQSAAREAQHGACVAVIVHYRCPEDLQRCVIALRATAPDVQVLVVENDPDHPSATPARELAAATDGVQLLEADRNRGFGAGCNLGIEQVLADTPQVEHILLINPDTEVEALCVDRLRETARRHPRAALVGGHIITPDGATWFENGRIRSWTLARSHCAAPRGAGDEFRTGFITGAMMLIRGDVLRDGLRFDERYFLYAEDLDLCRAAQAAGHELWIRRDARVVHRVAGSQRDEPAILDGLRAGQIEQMTRSKMLFARKWLPWPQRWVFYAVATVLKPLAGLLRTRNPRFLAPFFRGVARGLRSD